MNKREWRRKIKEQLNSLTAEEHQMISSKAAARLFESEEWKEASVIGVTLSRLPEINTRPIIERAWWEGKTVSAPKCIPETKDMIFRKLDSFSQLETVYSGLEEPAEEITAAIRRDKIDFLIVPGLVFSRSGYRIGFGGGYYDRYLAGYKGVAAALASERQVVDSLPVEAHDIPVQKIYTEKETVSCRE